MSGQNYELFKKEVKIWEKVTSVKEEARGMHILLNLPNQDKDPDGVKSKILEACDVDSLSSKDGLKNLLDMMDKYLGKDDIEDAWEKFQLFEDYRKSDDETFLQYISNFDAYYERVKAKKLTFPSSILAFKLLKGANLSDEERLVIMTGMDLEKIDSLYEDAKKSLKKFKCGAGATCPGAGGPSGFDNINVKTEPTYFASNRPFTSYRGRGGLRGFKGPGRNQNSYGRGGSSAFGSGNNGQSFASNEKRGMNPLSKDSKQVLRCYSCDSYRHFGYDCPKEPNINPIKDGKPKRCIVCESVRHMISTCPHRWEVNVPKKVGFVNDNGRADETAEIVSSNHPQDVPVVMFTRNKEELDTLSHEALSSGVLDSGCSQTVCGKKWFNAYLDQLDDLSRETVTKTQNSTIFQFGGEYSLPSLGKVRLPAEIVGQKVVIETDVVDSNIPLLFSNRALGIMKARINYETDEAEIFGKNVYLNKTSAGHHCLPLLPDVRYESINVVSINDLSFEEKSKTLLKLHRQYGHPSKHTFQFHLKTAGIWDSECDEMVKKLYDECAICKQYARTPARPVVALPMASDFNECVAMDLKYWKPGFWILHLIDMFSRYTVSVFVSRKKPVDILENVIKHWIGHYGVMKRILSDCGGEFNNAEMRELSSLLNIEVCTTAGESPFQNGLCERNHAVTDMILCKLQAQYPKTPLDVLLKWANMAKNSLQMWSGYSSYQLVFGSNPNLPNVLTDKVPALEDGSHSHVYMKHISAIHAAREQFIKTEACERIKRALRHRVRVNEQVFQPGDRVYYKREGRNKWLGPAIVIGQEGKVVFLKHGGYLVRVSPNRLIKTENVVEGQLESLYDHDNTLYGSDNRSLASSESKAVCEQSFESVEHNDKTSDRMGFDSKVQDVQDSRSDALGDGGHSDGSGTAVLDDVSSVNNSVSNVDVNEDKVDGTDKIPRALSRLLPYNKPGVSEMCEEERQLIFSVTVPRSRHSDADCMAAKREELDRLQQFNVYEEVTDNGQSCISTRWVIVEKGIKIKARLVARGFEESLVEAVDSPTIGKDCVRLVLALASAFNWTIKSTDIKSAFLQGQLISRDVFLKPPKEAGVQKGFIWKLRRCLYGLNDAARQFYNSLSKELEHLGCVKNPHDPSLFCKYNEGKLIGVLVSHVDDFLHAGDPIFETKVIAKLCQRFSPGNQEDKHFVYTGYQIVQKDDGSIFMDQSMYIQNIQIHKLAAARQRQKKQPLSTEEQSLYRSMVGALGWVVQGSRPDLAFQWLESSTKNNSALVEDFVTLGKRILSSQLNLCQIYFPSLGDPKCWRILMFADASHGNLANGTGSTGGHVIFLINSKGMCCPIAWKAAKLRRVCRSTEAAEGMSLADGMEHAVLLRSVLSHVLNFSNETIKVICVTDHEGLRNNVCNVLNPNVKDKRLKLEIAIIRESLFLGEVDDLLLCSSQEQLADCLTKRGASGQKLLQVLQTGFGCLSDRMME